MKQILLNKESSPSSIGRYKLALIRIGVRSKDALHLACAVATKCDYFLTTDDQLVKKASGVTEIKVTDPVSFIREQIE